MLNCSKTVDRPAEQLESALRHIYQNVAAFSPTELEEMVREKLIDAKRIPPELRTNFVRYRLGLRK